MALKACSRDPPRETGKGLFRELQHLFWPPLTMWPGRLQRQQLSLDWPVMEGSKRGCGAHRFHLAEKSLGVMGREKASS